jgi:hypothetical protein
LQRVGLGYGRRQTKSSRKHKRQGSAGKFSHNMDPLELKDNFDT